MTRTLTRAITAGALSALLLTGIAKAEPATVTVCTASGPALPACAVVGVLTHEMVQALNGKEAFGDNGEIMKVLAVPIHIVDGNIKGSERESGDLAKVLRSSLGISVKDINDYGLWGGPNSVFRKPLG